MAFGYQQIMDHSPLSLKLLNEQLAMLWKKLMADYPAGGTQASGAQQSVVLYVNAASGNDGNDGLTSATALKTVAAALASVSPAVALTLNIVGASGALAVANRSGPVIIRNPEGSASFTTCNIVQSNVKFNTQGGTIGFTGNVFCEGSTVQFIGSSTYGINISTTLSIQGACTATLMFVNTAGTNTSIIGIDVVRARVDCSSCNISGRSIAVRAVAGDVNYNSAAGSGNTIGLQATQAGRIISGSIPAGFATTLYSKSSGGIIFAGGVQQ